jgi:hypothetical protein
VLSDLSRFDGSRLCVSHQVFEFGEDLFDQIGGAGCRQEDETRARGSNRLVGGLSLVAAEGGCQDRANDGPCAYISESYSPTRLAWRGPHSNS